MKTRTLFLLLFPFCASAQIFNGVMFPGDANNDSIANHVDLLAIALNYGKTGPPRTNQAINWAPKGFVSWAGSLPATGVNAAFSDSDGNGIVNTDDLLAIEVNYDSTQNASNPPHKKYLPTKPAPTTARPKLVFLFDKDTATVNDTLRLDVYYEQPNGLPEALSPMGVAFTLEFDETLIKDTLTRIRFEPAANDLLFAAAASGFADTRAVPPGIVEFGAAGRHLPRLAFSRHLGTVEFIVVEVIIRSDTAYRDFKIDVSNVLFLDTLERSFQYDVDVDDVVLYQVVDSFAVCPGDANNDGQVNHLDVLATGLAYHREGIPRDTLYQGIHWSAKRFHPWGVFLPATKVDLAFADSDGNGLVDDPDVKAIQLNYDSTHHLAYPPSAPYTPPPANLTAPAFLPMSFAQDSAKAGQTLTLDVTYLPPDDNIPPALMPLGLAFVLTYDEALVKDSLTRVLFPPAPDLLAAGGATRFALARAVPPGRVEIGVAGKGQPALNQPRMLCTVEFTLEDVLPAGHPGLFQCTPELLMINALGQSMNVVATIDAVQLVVPTRDPQNLDGLRVFPSPFQEALRLELPDAPAARVLVFNAMGQPVYQREYPAGQAPEISTSGWPSGWYCVRVVARDGRTGLRAVAKR